MKFVRYVMLFVSILFASQMHANWLWDFETPGTYNSDYPYNWVSSNASNQNTPWCGLPAPNGGSRFFLLDKGGLNGTSYKGWYDNINVVAGQTYQFEFLVRNVKNDPNYPVIVFRVNGQEQVLNGGGTTYTLSPYNGNCNQWITITGSWTATSSSSVTVDISSNLNSFAGNDFAIDNVRISGSTGQPCNAVISAPDTVCSSMTPFPMSANPSGGVFVHIDGSSTYPCTNGFFYPYKGLGTYTIRYIINNATCVDTAFKTIEVINCCVSPTLEMAITDDTTSTNLVEEFNSIKYHKECGFVAVGNINNITDFRPRFARFDEYGTMQIGQDYIVQGPFNSSEGDLYNVENDFAHPEFYTCGWIQNTNNNSKDYILMKNAPGGEPMWSFVSNLPQDDYLNDIDPFIDLSVGAVGYAAQQKAIMATYFDPGGNPIWNKTYRDAAHPTYYYEGLSMTPADDNGDGFAMEGRVIAGYVGDALEGSQSWSDIFVMKLDMGGNILWSKVIPISGSKEVARSIIQMKDANGFYIPDRYALTGYAERLNGNGVMQKDAFFLDFDMAGQNFNLTYLTSDENIEDGYSIEQEKYEHFVIAGELLENGQKDALLIKYEINGYADSYKYGDPTYDDYARSMDIHFGYEGILFGGASTKYFNNATGSTNYYIVKTNQHGKTGCEDAYKIGETTIQVNPVNRTMTIDQFHPEFAEVEPKEFKLLHQDFCGSTTGCNASFVINPSTICNNEPAITLTATPPGGTFSGTGVTGNSFNPSGLSAGIYTLTYTVSPTCSVQAIIQVFEYIQANLPDGDMTVCINDPSFTVNATPAGGTFSGTGMNGSTFDPSVAGVGTHTITYTYGTNCPSTVSIDITVTGQINAQITSAPSPLCNNDGPQTILVSPTGGTLTGTGTSQNANGTSFSFDPTGLAAGTYTITYTYGTGSCAGTDQATIVVHEYVQANLPDGDMTVCINDPSFTVNATPAGGTFSGTGMSGSTFNPTTAGVGTHTITYTYGTDCPSTVSIDITVTGQINAQITSAPSPLCNNDGPQTILVSPTGGTLTGTGTSQNANGTSFEFDPTGLSAGNYTITYTYGTGSCAGTDQATIVVHEYVQANLPDGDMTVCINDPSFTVNATPAGGTFSGTGMSGSSFNPSVAGAGTHTITYTYGTDCPSTVSIDITVTNQITAQILSVPTPICNNVGSQPITVSPLGGTITGVGTSQNSNGTTFSFDPTGLSAGTYTVTYTYGTGSCAGTDQATIEVHEYVQASISNGDFTICENAAPVQIGVSPSGGTLSGPGVSGTTFDPSVAGVGVHTLIYNYGTVCPSEDKIEVTVESACIAIIQAINDTLCNSSLPVTFSASPAGGSWYYNFNGGAWISFNGTFTASQGFGTYHFMYICGTGACADTAYAQTVVMDCCSYNPFETAIANDTNTIDLIEEALSVKYKLDCGYVIVGNEHTPGGPYTPMLMDLNNYGTPINRNTYLIFNPFNSTEGNLINVEATSDGGYIACGWMMDDGSGDQIVFEGGANQTGLAKDFYVLKTDNAGNPMWSYVSNQILDDYLSDIEVSPNNEYIAVGYMEQIRGIVVTTYGLNGSHQWTRTFQDPGSDVMEALAIEPVDDDQDGVQDNGYIIAGYIGDAIDGSQATSDIYLIRLDAGGGIMWDAILPTTAVDIARDVKQMKDDQGNYLPERFALTGYQVNAGSKDAILVDYDNAAQSFDMYRLFSSRHEDAYALEQNPGTGTTFTIVGEAVTGTSMDAVCIQFDLSNGYNYVYVHGDENEMDYARSLEIDPVSKGIVIAGATSAYMTNATGNLNYSVIQTDANGYTDDCQFDYGLKDLMITSNSNHYNIKDNSFDPQHVQTKNINLDVKQAYCKAPQKTKRMSQSDDLEVEGDHVRVYPVPVENDKALVVEFVSNDRTAVHLRVMNLMGEIVIDKYITPEEGLNTYELDLHNISSGTYMLQVNGKQIQYANKIVILK